MVSERSILEIYLSALIPEQKNLLSLTIHSGNEKYRKIVGGVVSIIDKKVRNLQANLDTTPQRFLNSTSNI